MKNLIGISGKIGSGKDTVAKILQAISAGYQNEGILKILKDDLDCPSSRYTVKKFAGKLKTIASLITGIPVEMFEDQEFKKTNLGTEWSSLNPSAATPAIIPMTVRDLLQKLGTEAMRNGLHTNVWVNALFADYTPIHHDHVEGGFEYPNWIITDVRFPNEAEAVREHKGFLLRVERTGKNNTGDHPSETSLDGYPYFDFVLHNDGTLEDLIEKVRNFYNMYVDVKGGVRVS